MTRNSFWLPDKLQQFLTKKFTIHEEFIQIAPGKNISPWWEDDFGNHDSR